MGRVREKTHFSDSQEETACLGPRCCSFQDAVSGEADASLHGCVSSVSRPSQIWGQSRRGQMRCPELLGGVVAHTVMRRWGCLAGKPAAAPPVSMGLLLLGRRGP